MWLALVLAGALVSDELKLRLQNEQLVVTPIVRWASAAGHQALLELAQPISDELDRIKADMFEGKVDDLPARFDAVSARRKKLLAAAIAEGVVSPVVVEQRNVLDKGCHLRALSYTVDGLGFSTGHSEEPSAELDANRQVAELALPLGKHTIAVRSMRVCKGVDDRRQEVLEILVSRGERLTVVSETSSTGLRLGTTARSADAGR